MPGPLDWDSGAAQKGGMARSEYGKGAERWHADADGLCGCRCQQLTAHYQICQTSTCQARPIIAPAAPEGMKWPPIAGGMPSGHLRRTKQGVNVVGGGAATSMPQTVFSAQPGTCGGALPALLSRPHWGRSSKLAAVAAAAVCRHTCRAHGRVPGSPGDGLDDVHSRGGLAGGLVEHSATSGALRLHLLGAHRNRAAALLADLGCDRGAGERGARGAQSSGHVLPALGP